MFSKSKAASGSASMAPATPASHGTFSVIGADVVITGNLVAKGDVHIDGRVEGDVGCASLVLGESGCVTGGISAETARLSGEVKGAIAAGTLALDKSARVSGDVSYRELSMEAGARVDGKLQHKPADNGLKLVAAQGE
jgi:cytoskeletal protein CcmA (bactofilin family)